MSDGRQTHPGIFVRNNCCRGSGRPKQVKEKRMNTRMTFISKIKALFSPSNSDAVRRARRTYIVDGARLIDEKTGRRLGPREQVQVLQMLAKTAKQESIDIHVLLESDRELREVKNGGDFNGVTVHFLENGEQLVAHALKLCRKSSGAVLVSSGVTLEGKAAEAGMTVMRNGTFRKAFCHVEDSGKSRGGEGRKRKPRQNRHKGKRQGRTDSGSQGDDSARAPQGDESVRSLIDLVE